MDTKSEMWLADTTAAKTWQLLYTCSAFASMSWISTNFYFNNCTAYTLYNEHVNDDSWWLIRAVARPVLTNFHRWYHIVTDQIICCTNYIELAAVLPRQSFWADFMLMSKSCESFQSVRGDWSCSPLDLTTPGSIRNDGCYCRLLRNQQGALHHTWVWFDRLINQLMCGCMRAWTHVSCIELHVQYSSLPV